MGTPKSDADLLQDYTDYHQRLDRLAFPILQSNVNACPRQKLDDGVRWHLLSDYPQNLRPEVQRQFGFEGPDDNSTRVFFIRPDSLAATHNIAVGDTPSEIPELAPDQSDLICHYPLQIRFEPNANAYAGDGAIIVTSGLIRSLSDEQLSLVIAHELAHHVLGHVREAYSEANELDADRQAIYYMRAAGLDYESAARSWAATAQPHKGRTRVLDNSKARRENFETVLDEIDAQNAKTTTTSALGRK